MIIPSPILNFIITELISGQISSMHLTSIIRHGIHHHSCCNQSSDHSLLTVKHSQQGILPHAFTHKTRIPSTIKPSIQCHPFPIFIKHLTICVYDVDQSTSDQSTLDQSTSEYSTSNAYNSS